MSICKIASAFYESSCDAVQDSLSIVCQQADGVLIIEIYLSEIITLYLHCLPRLPEQKMEAILPS